MSEIAELRDLQREYTENRNHCYVLIRKQGNDLNNCIPSASTIRACREREAQLRADADGWQKRIDAIQKKLDEAIGIDDD
ncbi:hypothetical protein ACFVWL_10290 [Microbacterium sp. NPDC058269]|uniref:hypothetical protein n=1 Tax=Microbacterium sp. NPDC058269 TaxID=3346414 RepID=UPI0036DA15EC